MNEPTELPQELLNFKIDYDLPEEIIVVNVNEEESAMTDQAIHFFLDEVLKKKKELHDPRHRCNRFYGEIRDILFAQYGLCFGVKTLERKFHYLKRQFDSMCQNKNRTNAKGSKAWEFFDKMMGVFAEEMDIDDAPTMASLYPDPPLPKSALPLPTPIKKKGRVRVNHVKKENANQSEQQENTTTASVAAAAAADTDTEETIWTHTVVLDYLNECVQMRDAFWNPNHRRVDILTDLQVRMKNKGYTFKLDTLDRKLRNFKLCYHGTIQTMEKKGMPINNGRHPWPYFNQMHTLYNGYKEQRDILNKKRKQKVKGTRKRRVTTSTGAGVVSKKITARKPRTRLAANKGRATSPKRYRPRPRRCKPDPLEEQQLHVDAPKTTSEKDSGTQGKFHELICAFSPGDFDSHVDEEDDSRNDDSTKNTETSEAGSEDAHNFEFAKKMLALEKRRTIATEQLLEQLKESNRIRKRKIDFNQMKLSYLRARAKRKQLHQ